MAATLETSLCRLREGLRCRPIEAGSLYGPMASDQVISRLWQETGGLSGYQSPAARLSPANRWGSSFLLPQPAPCPAGRPA